MAKGSGSTRLGGTASGSVAVGGGNSIKSFLLGYQPASRMFTSDDEIKLVSDKLGLQKMNEEQLTDMRNQVVTIYRDAMDKEIKYDKNGDFAGRTEKYWDYSNAMQSVTAVIDYVKVRKGVSVERL